MASILWAVYLIAAVTVDCRHLKGHNSQNTTIDELTEDFDIEAVDHEIHLVGDMMLTEEQWSALRQRKAIKDTDYRWSEGPKKPDGNQYPTVGYVFQSQEPSVCNTISQLLDCSIDFDKQYCRKTCSNGFEAFPAELQPLVEMAMEHWMNHTCIKFEDITNEPPSNPHWQKHHLLFDTIDACKSSVGMQNSSIFLGQTISIAGCDDVLLKSNVQKIGDIVHEIGHALGFYHEQSRSDRDSYIEIIKRNIKPDKLSQFDFKMDIDFDIKYDYTSVMQYSAYANTISQANTNKKKITIVTTDPVDFGLIIEKHEKLSFRDIHLANKMYGCEGKWEKTMKCKQSKRLDCGLDGYYGRDCKCNCAPHKTGSQCQDVVSGSNDDYYFMERNLNEKIVSPKTLTGIAPFTKEAKFVKSIIPPACKMAKVAFTSSNLFSGLCYCQFLYAVIDENDLEGETLCHEDLRNGANLISEEKITITTIIKEHCYSDFLKGKTLWEAEVTFVDTECPTNPTGHTWCSSIFQFVRKWTETKKHWVEGKLKSTFPKTVSSWNLELTFNQDINDLIIWDMKRVITSDRTVTLTPKTYNTEQVAGNILNPDFQFNYFGSETPKLISVTLNGDELC